MAAYNPGRFLQPAIESVVAQSYPDWELLVIDDGSTDGSVEAARETLDDSRIRWFRQENSGKPVALNRALKELRGEFYAIHDADDLSYPQRIEAQVRCMQENADVAAVFSGHEIILNGRQMAPRARAKSRKECQADINRFRMPAHDPTAMYRMAAVREYRYEESLPVVEGYDYILRVGEQWPMLVLGECLYGYRVHPESITRADPARREKLVQEVHRRGCERRGIDPNRFQADTRVRADNNLPVDFMESVVDLRAGGCYLQALRTGLACVRIRPTDAHYYKALLFAILPSGLRRRLRPSERARSLQVQRIPA
jgi:glycosyltransferase involved in cell wall biosynthesis